MITLVIMSLAALAVPGRVFAAAATCTPIASLPANVSDPNAAFDTAAHVMATFNFARQQEGCTVPLRLDAAAYTAASSQMQTLILVNAERQDRGLSALQLDDTLLSQIDFNHSLEMAQYNYQNHPSPINQPGGKNDPFTRLTVNPAINGHESALAENIAWGWSTAAQAVYTFMYQDASSSWGHRQNILGYIGGTPGHYSWLGIGIAKGGSFGVYYTLDFLDDSGTMPYAPPPGTDTQPPTMSPPTIVNANTVQVTNVRDDSDGSTSGAAGVTGVVFYVGMAVDPSGKFLTVAAKQTAPGIWTASVSATNPTTLHAVAVDGSGNYTDCTASANSCFGS